MAEVRFYHLQRQSVVEALPLLARKAYAAGFRTLVRLPDSGLMRTLDAQLWTFDAASFLPHASAGAADPERQPIYLTTGPERPQGASLVILVEGAEDPDILSYERSLILFDGRSDERLQQARAQWRTYKELGAPLSYWQQTESGGWEQKL